MKTSLKTLFTVAALTLSSKAVVITGSVSDFTGSADLLLDPSTNVVAVDVNGAAGPFTVGGVSFQSDTGGPVSGGGATVTTGATHSIAQWATATPPSYVGPDAANLASIMHSIRWSLAPAAVTVDVSGLNAGTIYNIQLLFSENGSTADRHWDIGVDGALVVDNVDSNGTALNTGRVYSGNFDPGVDGILNIVMAQDPLPGDPNNTAPTGADNNPILHAVIVHEVIPEPSGVALLGIGLTSFFFRRRRS